MYIPASFLQSDSQALHSFIARHGFATLISQHDGVPFASHLPLLLDPSPSPHGALLGHMARANPQWKSANGQSVLAIFHGPHAYVSPSWYREQNVVPTWNYVTVHAYGTLSLIEGRDRLLELLRRTVDVYESPRSMPWSIESPEPDFTDRLLDAIVGFEIAVDRIEGKWKLSQNHSQERRERVVQSLRESGRPDDLEIAALMAAGLGGE